MSESRGNGLLAAAVLGALYYVFSSAARPLASETGWPAFLGIMPVVLGLIPFAFTDDAQVRWYHRALLAPWVGGFGVVLATMFIPSYACLYVLMIYVLVLPISLLVWLVGAVRLWRR